MPKDQDQCELCHPRTIFVDRNRPVELDKSAVMHEDCPTAFAPSTVTTECVLSSMVDANMRPITLKDCKVPEKVLDAGMIYKLEVAFRKNGILSNEKEQVNLFVLNNSPPAPSCTLEGFKDTIELAEGAEHRVNLKVYETLEQQEYRWTCTPVLNQMLSGEAECPFEARPLTTNPQLIIKDEDFKPAGSKFELTLNMMKQNSNIEESCSVFVQKQFSETSQDQVTLVVTQEEEVADPTRENTFVCGSETNKNEQLVYQWDVIDVFKGSKIMLTEVTQDKNKLIISENQLRFNREYIVKCKATGANIVGEASHRIKTVEKASDIAFSVEPNTGIAETTTFSLSV